ncbi:MAG TPA: flagellar protein FlgN [Bacteroidetes bacterium]|nr:flagellar protein FlgN [Bacteroidota bacterium]
MSNVFSRNIAERLPEPNRAASPSDLEERMDNLIGKLVDVIKREEGLLADFLGLLEQQKTILVKNDTEEFERTVARQEELIHQIKELEEERVRQVRSLARDMDSEESEITLTRLVEMSLGQLSDELKDAKLSMNHLVGRIKRVNQVNQYLIKRSMHTVQRNIDWLIDGAELEVTYEANGRIRGREGRAVLVNKTY